MIEKRDILKMVKHIRRRSKGVPDRKVMHPSRDWFIGLGFSTTVFVVGLTYVGFSFVDYLDQVDDVSYVESTVIQYDQKKIQAAIDFFETKQKKFDVLRADIYEFEPVITTESDILEEEGVSEEGDVDISDEDTTLAEDPKAE